MGWNVSTGAPFSRLNGDVPPAVACGGFVDGLERLYGCGPSPPFVSAEDCRVPYFDPAASRNSPTIVTNQSARVIMVA